ncbi:MAG: stage II sporulation protein M [Thermoanaerobaculia bacterium]|nr:stage II sporulation protein M [Thermoanaerobaculia bacterium]
MSYSRFVSLRRPVWDRFEEGLLDVRERPDTISYQELEELAVGYRQILQDHAWARSRFPETEAARRLHRLALAGSVWLQRGEGERRYGMLRFFFRSFPRAFRRLLPHMALCGLLFWAAGLFGLGSALFEPELASVLLGPDAVEGLARGRLWTESLTTTVPPAYSSSAIATNNMSVAITAWVGGALAGIGSLWIVLLNGYMLGAVTGGTLQWAMAGELLEFVSAHGILEITLILVTAGAGLGIGQAILTAGDRPRMMRIREAVRDALVVLGGALPWFVILGLVEAMVSPHPGLGWVPKLALGLTLEALFLVVALGSPEPSEAT